MIEVQYRVISESEGHITERGCKQCAEKRAEKLNQEPGLPTDHYVTKHEEVF